MKQAIFAALFYVLYGEALFKSAGARENDVTACGFRFNYLNFPELSVAYATLQLCVEYEVRVGLNTPPL